MIQIRFYTQISWSRIQRVPKMLGRGSCPQCAAGDKPLHRDAQCLHSRTHDRRIADASGIEWPIVIGQLRIGPTGFGVPHENEMFVRHLRFARPASPARVNAFPDN